MDYENPSYAEYQQYLDQRRSTEENVAPWADCDGCQNEFNYGCAECQDCCVYCD